MALTASQIKANPEEAEHYIEQILAENEKLRWLVKLGDFSGLRPNSELFKLALRIKQDRF